MLLQVGAALRTKLEENTTCLWHDNQSLPQILELPIQRAKLTLSPARSTPIERYLMLVEVGLEDLGGVDPCSMVY